MILGFTGSRYGLQPAQGGSLARLLRLAQGVTEFHHGCCKGGDTEAVTHLNYWIPDAKIVGHPSNLEKWTHPTALGLSHELLPPKPPLERNLDIVNAAEWIIACPSGPEQFQGSGTWATIRTARKAKKVITLIWPDGSITCEDRR